MISKKIILTGSFGVGKTSLFNQFLYRKFDEKYLTTIGVRVDKKQLDIEGDQISLLLWDIAGEVSQDKIPHTYFLGTSGIVYVFDLSRPITFENIQSDIEYIKEKVPGVVLRVIGNKKDLFDEKALHSLIEEHDIAFDFLTSAKTGENVEELFISIGKALLANERSSF